MSRLPDSKILVVEDDPNMCQSIQDLLSLQGFDVRTSESLPDACNALRAANYDLVLLDLKLHDQCGFTLMDHLVESNMDTHVIVVTGQDSETHAITALKKGAIDYLKKPFEPDDLLESVDYVLNRQRHQRELVLFKNIVGATSVAIVIGDPNGRVVYANAAYGELMNPDEAGLNSAPSASTDYGHDVSIDEQIRKALKTKLPWEGRVDMVNAAGQPFVVWKLADPVPEPIGGLTYGVALMCDITRQLERELTITSSRERYRTVLDSQQEYLCRLNTEFVVTFVNKTYAGCWGKTPQAMIGQPIMTFIQDSIQPMLLSTLEAIRSGATPIESEYRVADESGSGRWQQWRFEGIVDANGQVAEIQGVGCDVTRKKMILEETEENRAKFQNLAEITSDWIWEVDERGFYTYASPVAYDLLGYRPEEVIGKRVFDFMPADEAKRIRILFQGAVASGEPLKNIENTNLHKDGSRVTLETNGVPIVDESGEVVGYRGVDRDISIRKRAEIQLHEESNKLKQALAKVKNLSGMLPICASCKKIRDDKGYWNQIEAYIETHSDAAFSHGICPQCARKLYPEIYEE